MFDPVVIPSLLDGFRIVLLGYMLRELFLAHYGLEIGILTIKVFLIEFLFRSLQPYAEMPVTMMVVWERLISGFILG
jgi:hypothetical protein